MTDLTESAAPEVIITFEMADVKGRLTYGKGQWLLTAEDTGLDRDDYDPAKARFAKVVTGPQAAAILALMTGGFEDDGKIPSQELLLVGLYTFAEPVFVDVPHNLRLIP